MKMYKVREVAEMLNMDVKTIRRFIYADKLKAYKIGSEWRIKEDEFEEFIKNKVNF